MMPISAYSARVLLKHGDAKIVSIIPLDSFELDLILELKRGPEKPPLSAFCHLNAVWRRAFENEKLIVSNALGRCSIAGEMK